MESVWVWCASIGNSRDMASEESGSKQTNPASSYSDIITEKISSMIRRSAVAKEKGDLKLSLTILSRAIAVDPTNEDLFRERGVVCHQLGDMTAAIANFNKSISMNACSAEAVTTYLADAYFRRGESLDRDGQHQLALNDFTAATKLYPEEKGYVMKRMECLFSLGHYQECLVMVERELESGPPTTHLYLMHAKVCLIFDKSKDTYQSLMRALELEPAHEEVVEMVKEREREAGKLHGQAVKFLLLGQKDGAYSKISAAIDCDPKPGQFHVLRGAIHRQNRRFDVAVDEFLTAIDKCKTVEEDKETVANAQRQLVLTYNDFALHCFKQRRYEEAIQLLNKAVEEEKTETGIYLNRGECFYRLGNLSFALADYCKAQQLAPNDRRICGRVGQTQCELGILQFRKRKFREAEQLFTAAINNNPRISQFHLYRARTSYELNKIDEAKQDILQVMVLDPNCDSVLPLIARIFPGKTRDDIINSSAMMEAVSNDIMLKQDEDDEGREREEKEAGASEGRQKELIQLFYQLKLDTNIEPTR